MLIGAGRVSAPSAPSASIGVCCRLLKSIFLLLVYLLVYGVHGKGGTNKVALSNVAVRQAKAEGKVKKISD
jgi:hypothetical protein